MGSRASTGLDETTVRIESGRLDNCLWLVLAWVFPLSSALGANADVEAPAMVPARGPECGRTEGGGPRRHPQEVVCVSRQIRGELFDEALQNELLEMYRRTEVGKPAGAAGDGDALAGPWRGRRSGSGRTDGGYSQRWPLVLGCLDAEEPAFSQGALFDFRMWLLGAGMDRRLLEARRNWRGGGAGLTPKPCGWPWTPAPAARPGGRHPESAGSRGAPSHRLFGGPGPAGSGSRHRPDQSVAVRRF